MKHGCRYVIWSSSGGPSNGYDLCIPAESLYFHDRENSLKWYYDTIFLTKIFACRHNAKVRFVLLCDIYAYNSKELQLFFLLIDILTWSTKFNVNRLRKTIRENIWFHANFIDHFGCNLNRINVKTRISGTLNYIKQALKPIRNL